MVPLPLKNWQIITFISGGSNLILFLVAFSTQKRVFRSSGILILPGWRSLFFGQDWCQDEFFQTQLQGLSMHIECPSQHIYLNLNYSLILQDTGEMEWALHKIQVGYFRLKIFSLKDVNTGTSSPCDEQPLRAASGSYIFRVLCTRYGALPVLLGQQAQIGTEVKPPSLAHTMTRLLAF